MGRIFAFVMAGCVVTACPAAADNTEILRGPVPAWVAPSELMPVPDDADGLMFVRSTDSLIHLDEDGQASYLGYRIKILHQNALQLGNLSIAWNPAAGAPTVHTVTIHRGATAIDVLATSNFEILRREDQLETAMLDGMHTAVLRVPDLRVGDELEVSLTTRAKEPTLGTDSFGLMFVVPEPQPGRYRLGLNWDDGQEPQIRISPDLASLVRRDSNWTILDLDNPELLIPPKDAPPRFRWRRIIEFSDFADWAAISRRFAPLYAAAAELEAGSPLKEEAARIVAEHPAILDRAKAALKLVQQEVRYIYVGLDGGNFTPVTADETWRRRYGDCKGKTVLLLALLGELGIPAEAVLVSNTGPDDGLDERLPSPGLFDHVLVRLRIDNTDYWLDGTLPPVVPPGVEPAMPYQWVLPLSEDGSSLEHLPWQPAQSPDEITLFEIDARAGFDQPAKITSTSIVRGIVGLQQQVQFSGLTRSQLLNAFRQQMVGNTWQTIEDVEWRFDVARQTSVLKIIGMGTVDWDNDDAGARSLSLPGGGFSPPERRVRASDQDQSLPFYNEPEFDCRVTTVRLPESTEPANWRFNSTFDTHIFGRNYYRAFEKRDGEIRMVRGLRVEKPEIDAATARADNDRIANFDNSMAWIFYDPEDRRTSPKPARPVPATYEIDWAAAQVPCLAGGAAP